MSRLFFSANVWPGSLMSSALGGFCDGFLDILDHRESFFQVCRKLSQSSEVIFRLDCGEMRCGYACVLQRFLFSNSVSKAQYFARAAFLVANVFERQ